MFCLPNVLMLSSSYGASAGPEPCRPTTGSVRPSNSPTPPAVFVVTACAMTSCCTATSAVSVCGSTAVTAPTGSESPRNPMMPGTAVQSCANGSDCTVPLASALTAKANATVETASVVPSFFIVVSLLVWMAGCDPDVTRYAPVGSNDSRLCGIVSCSQWT